METIRNVAEKLSISLTNCDLHEMHCQVILKLRMDPFDVQE